MIEWKTILYSATEIGIYEPLCEIESAHVPRPIAEGNGWRNDGTYSFRISSDSGRIRSMVRKSYFWKLADASGGETKPFAGFIQRLQGTDGNGLVFAIAVNGQGIFD